MSWFLHAVSDWIIFGWIYVHSSCTCYKWCFVSSAHREIFRTWFSQILLVKAWLNFLSNAMLQKYGKLPKTLMLIQHSYWNPDFKISLFLLHGYNTPQLKDIAMSAITFLPHNFKLLSTHQMEFLVIPFNLFLEISWNYVSIIITIINNSTALV